MVIDDLDPRRKRPFLRYLLWVYMNVGGDKIDTGSIILHHDMLVANYTLSRYKNSYFVYIGKCGPSLNTSVCC